MVRELMALANLNLGLWSLGGSLDSWKEIARFRRGALSSSDCNPPRITGRSKNKLVMMGFCVWI